MKYLFLVFQSVAAEAAVLVAVAPSPQHRQPAQIVLLQLVLFRLQFPALLVLLLMAQKQEGRLILVMLEYLKLLSKIDRNLKSSTEKQLIS